MRSRGSALPLALARGAPASIEYRRTIPAQGLVSDPPLRWLAFTTLYVTVASLVGYVMGRLIEMPALRLRDRLFPRVSRRRARSQQEPVSQGQ
jgi:hypothetical protein